MKWQLYCKKYIFWSYTMAVFVCSEAYALPFNLVPKTDTTLPTSVEQGQTVNAFYTITNLSRKTLTHNYIQYLPLNVAQVTENESIVDLCGSTFMLTANGTTGDSCTLQLTISGAVNALDPNPAHHLFACLPGGKSCAGTYYPLNVDMTPPSHQWVVTGKQYTQDSPQGVVAVSRDGGHNWQFQTLAYPETIVSSSFAGSSCASNTCVVVGQYSTDTTTLPGLATSPINNLTHWIQQILPASEPSANGSLAGVSCYGTPCIAAGQYYENSGLFPYIAKTLNQGATWIQQVLPLIDPTTYAFAFFNGVNCSENLCTAVGSYFGQSFEQYSGVAYSLDGGQNWQQQVLPLVAGTASNQLNGVACLGISCIAVGDYLNEDASNDSPGVAITTNAGVTWSNALISTLPEPYTQGEWQAISCTSQYCVAAGYYSNVSYAGYLGVAVTTDFGQTWNQQALAIPTDPAGLTNGILYGVKCIGDTCIAVGNYYDNSSSTYPVFITSIDRGQTWSQQVFSNHSGILISGIG